MNSFSLKLSLKKMKKQLGTDTLVDGTHSINAQKGKTLVGHRQHPSL